VHSAHPAGGPKPARLPQLFYHEAHALRLGMDILFKLVTEGAHPSSSSDVWQQEVAIRLHAADDGAASTDDVVQQSEHRIVQLCHTAIAEYVTKTQSGQLVSLEHFDEVLVGLVNNFAALPHDLFLKYLPQFYDELTQLIEYANVHTIRHAIRLLFANNIAMLLNLNKPTTPTDVSQ
jgi:hypothetical protein